MANINIDFEELERLERIMSAKILVAKKAVEMYHRAVAANQDMIEYINKIVFQI